MNTTILLVALLLLVLTPFTLSASVTVRQVIVLVVMVIAMVAANAVLIRVSFSGLIALAHRMETLDILQLSPERLPENGGPETRALISGFNTMRDRLESERRESTRRGVAALESERLRISQELHDEIGQRMTGIVLQLSRIHDEAPDTVSLRVERVQGEARAVMVELGALAWQIRPGILDDLGLLSALKALTHAFNEHGHARIGWTLPHRLPPMTSEAELAVYRIAQEALTNAVRHSDASRITVDMQVTEQDLILQITDDGDGLPDANQEDPGLRGMRERALLIAGRLDVRESPPHGLQVELTVPIANLSG